MRAVFVILCRQIRRVDLSHQVSDGQRTGPYPDRLYHRHEIQSVVGLNLFLLVVIKVKLYNPWTYSQVTKFKCDEIFGFIKLFLVEAAIQCKTSSTTRFVQTGQFTKTAETMTSVSTRDASTQKKLRRPKQVHFTQQFQPSRRTTSTQSDMKSVTTTGTQWKEKDSEIATKKDKKFSQECTFRNAIATITGSNCSRMADSILRRLHEHQKQNEFCGTFAITSIY